MTQQERKFKLKLEFSKHFDTKTLQIRRRGVYYSENPRTPSQKSQENLLGIPKKSRNPLKSLKFP